MSKSDAIETRVRFYANYAVPVRAGDHVYLEREALAQHAPAEANAGDYRPYEPHGWDNHDGVYIDSRSHRREAFRQRAASARLRGQRPEETALDEPLDE